MKKYGLKYGGIAGVLTILYLFAFYCYDPKTMLGLKVFYSSYLISVIAMVYAVQAYKKDLGGRIKINQAIQASFSTFVVASIIYYVVYYLTFNFLDPSLVDLQQELAIEFYTWFFPPDKSEKIIEEMTGVDTTVKIKNVLYGFSRGAIGGFFVAFLISTYYRNDKGATY